MHYRIVIILFLSLSLLSGITAGTNENSLLGSVGRLMCGGEENLNKSLFISNDSSIEEIIFACDKAIENNNNTVVAHLAKGAVLLDYDKAAAFEAFNSAQKVEPKNNLIKVIIELANSYVYQIEHPSSYSFTPSNTPSEQTKPQPQKYSEYDQKLIKWCEDVGPKLCEIYHRNGYSYIKYH